MSVPFKKSFKLLDVCFMPIASQHPYLRYCVIFYFQPEFSRLYSHYLSIKGYISLYANTLYANTTCLIKRLSVHCECTVFYFRKLVGNSQKIIFSIC